MKIKVFIAAIAGLMITNFSNAQGARLEGGLNLANVSITDDGEVDDAKTLTSFHVGLRGDVPIGDVFAFQPGILFTGKGTKIQSGDPSQPTYYKATLNPYYIEMPLNFVFRTPPVTKTRFFAGAGPYIAVGVTGNQKIEGKSMGVAFSEEDDIEFSNDDPGTIYIDLPNYTLKRFDYGLNGTAGIEGKSMTLSVNYGLGLAKLRAGSDSDDDNNNKHRVLSFTLGFKL
jgi:hypothetical protein